MASAEEYAQWIVKNSDKKGTPEFDTVAKAYQSKKQETEPAVKKVGRAFMDWTTEMAQGVGSTIANVAQPEKQLEQIKEFGGKVADIAKQPFTKTAEQALSGIAKTGTEIAKDPYYKGTKAALNVASVVAPIGAERMGLFLAPAERQAMLLEKSLPDVVKRHKLVTESVGLPKSEDVGVGPAGQDIESRTRAVSEQTLKSLLDKRKAEAGELWDRYRARGLQLENQRQFFTAMPEGQSVIKSLKEIETGVKGGKTVYSDSTRKMATDLREALSGVDKNNPLRNPVDINLIDEQLQMLRQRQYDAGPTGVSRIERENVGKLADKLETALEKWVGKENYPREHYRQASVDINKWGSKLGQALTGRQDLDYLGAAASPEEHQGPILRKVFSDRTTVAETRSLLGDEQFKPLAEQYVSNSMRRRSADQARVWFEKNDPWLKDFPDINKKALDYLQQIAEREGNAEVLKYWSGLAKKYGKYATYGAATYEGAKVAGYNGGFR